MNQSVGELRVDFVSGAVAHRLRFGGGRGQALAKAMGLRAGKTPSIIDATAGLGRDSFLLASLGAQVTLIERSEQMHSLLVQGMERARLEGGEFSAIMDRLTLLQGDAKELLPGLSAEAILIDPMHPPRTNSALVTRELRQVRRLAALPSGRGFVERGFGHFRSPVHAMCAWPGVLGVDQRRRVPARRRAVSPGVFYGHQCDGQQ